TKTEEGEFISEGGGVR
nr:RecName: Full=Fibrinogen alpha chain; Contains: RecName: Full=Fibrinopeptide A [Equus asinus]prf//650771D fibrinopeptide A [Equus asinus]prf//660906B fibrinopeptide A [Equus caballus]